MKDLDRMQKKNMEDEVEKTISVLQKDGIQPIDFGSPTDEQILETIRGWKETIEVLKMRLDIEVYEATR